MAKDPKRVKAGKKAKATKVRKYGHGKGGPKKSK
jgi:hypothetical protein